MAVLLGTETRGLSSSTHALDGASAYEAVDVGPRSRSLRRDADHCVRQLGVFLLLVGLGAAVLPNLPQLDPDPHHDPYITHVFHGSCGKCHHRTGHWIHRRRIYRWYVVGPSVGSQDDRPDPYPSRFTPRFYWQLSERS